ncbi:hypothetical protein TNCV_1837141 [Trichonephila clavipes]|nr:hypothetical protein TNCV_1837141 [Trichonephila clavipes]
MVPWDHVLQKQQDSPTYGDILHPTPSQNITHVSRLKPDSQHEMILLVFARQTRFRWSGIRCSRHYSSLFIAFHVENYGFVVVNPP